MPAKLSETYLIGKLQEAGEVLGRVPTAVQIDSLEGFPGRKTYGLHFGSWNNSLVQAGYEVNQVHYIESEIRQLTEGEAMYVAACIDTDGTIGINTIRKKYLEPKVSIANNHMGFLEHVQKMAGGGYIGNHRCIEKLRPTHNPQFHLAFRVNEMRDLLPQILPFLVIKREKAIEVLSLLKERG